MDSLTAHLKANLITDAILKDLNGRAGMDALFDIDAYVFKDMVDHWMFPIEEILNG